MFVSALIGWLIVCIYLFFLFLYVWKTEACPDLLIIASGKMWTTELIELKERR